MNNEITDERIMAFLEGAPDTELERALEKSVDLQNRVAQLKELLLVIDGVGDQDVPASIGMNLQSAIEEEKAKSEGQAFPWLQVAAAVALLVLGYFMGSWSSPVSANSSELAELRREIKSLREVTLTSTLQQHSASERILAVNQIEEKSEINEDLLRVMIETLNSDESPNVRYAALQALKKFINDANVKAELVKSLESQSDPLIQISLITILVEAEEKSAIAPLKDMIDKEQILPEVKRQAEVALQVLT